MPRSSTKSRHTGCSPCPNHVGSPVFLGSCLGLLNPLDLSWHKIIGGKDVETALPNASLRGRAVHQWQTRCTRKREIGFETRECLSRLLSLLGGAAAHCGSRLLMLGDVCPPSHWHLGAWRTCLGFASTLSTVEKHILSVVSSWRGWEPRKATQGFKSLPEIWKCRCFLGGGDCSWGGCPHR
jgi:hypothetical protein